MKSKLSIVLFLFVIPFFGFSQVNFPENGPLYIDTVVPRIDITINPDTLAWIYENVESDIEWHARFIYDNGTIRDTIDPVGFRLRGNTSRVSQKKSFKVSFNSFTSGGKYYGVEKLNLNGEHNDPSIMRSKVMWDLLRKWGIPAPRANHVQVYINGNYYGLYISVEHIDEEFILSRYNNNDGNLYKCLYPADLAYHGTNQESYKMMADDRRVYELKINEEGDNYSDLAAFITQLNVSSDGLFNCKLSEHFNTIDYLKIIAADIICGNWDGYIYNKNNFYLYHNTSSDKFEYLPYDVDNTFGIDWFDIDWANRNLYAWQPSGNEPRALYTRIMADTKLRNQYTYYAKKLLRAIDIDSLESSLISRRDMIAPFVETDPYYPLDYGYSFNDFNRSYNEVIGAHVKTSLFGYLNNRFSSLIEQLESNSMLPVVNHIKHSRQEDNKLHIKAFAETVETPLEVQLFYSLNDGSWQLAEMYDDGAHQDGAVADGFYGIVLENITAETKVSYLIKATDQLGATQMLPCAAIVVQPLSGETPMLYINEFMADNDGYIADEYGNYNDWIEVYNGDSEAVFLGDFFLTDNLDTPDKWQMPDVNLAPGEFILFWADGSPSLGDHHADFKLSKDGEQIGIFNGQLAPVDTLSFGAQTTDVSYGRLPDGDAEWVFFDEATPGVSNLLSSTDETSAARKLLAYPNPSTNGMVILSEKTDCTVYNLLGNSVFSGSNVRQITTANWVKGLYLIVTPKGESIRLVVQ